MTRLPLTKTGIAQAKARIGWSSFAEPKGLMWRTTPAGAGAFYIRTKVNRRVVMRKIADEAVPIPEVIRLHAKIVGATAHGENPWAANDEPTLRELAEEYDQLQRKLGKKGAWRAKDDVVRSCKSILDKRPSELDPPTVLRWFQKETITRGKASANRGRAMLLAMLRATGAKFDVHAFAAVKSHRMSPRTRVINDEELKVLVTAIAGLPLREKTYYHALLRTGLRKTELAALRRDELDLDAGLIRLPGARRKNGQPLEVPLDATSVELLKQYRREAPFGLYCFPSRVHGKPHRFSQHWRKLRKTLNLEDVRLHDYRRSFGHRAALAGLTELEISAALGNSSLVAARHYTSLAGKPQVIQDVQTAVILAMDKATK